MVFYPLQILLKAGIREIMLITGPEHSGAFMQYLGSGTKSGCSFTYRIQDQPRGIAQALGMAEAFADEEPICAILGDNLFEDDLSEHIHSWSGKGGHLFLREVTDPQRFGVATLRDAPPRHGELSLSRARRGIEPRRRAPPSFAPSELRTGKQGVTLEVASLEEKPTHPKSNLAVTGCYLYDSRCFEMIKELKPSARGELEITDVSKKYLAQGELTATILQGWWVDAGTHEALKRAAEFVHKGDYC